MNKLAKQKLVFVYNAKGDTISELKYIAKDITGSHNKKSRCGLCALTHGTFSMRESWQDYLNNLPIDTEFLHRDQFNDNYDMDLNFPAVLQQTDNGLEVLVSAQEINNAETLADLKELISNKIPAEKN